ncbi:MAG: hypothetical protein K6E33_01010 [Lachnospiraceae bacterium]|nr:hypothetical protein [Lachnospiraceae bacterium]
MADIAVMSLSGIYDRENFYHRYLEDNIAVFHDLTGVSGANGYCSEDSETRFQELMEGNLSSRIHFIDNGNYHYMSLLWMEAVMEKGMDYALIYFDNHSDRQDAAFGGLLSCGSWVKEAEDRLSGLHKTIWVNSDEVVISGEVESNDLHNAFSHSVNETGDEMGHGLHNPSIARGCRLEGTAGTGLHNSQINLSNKCGDTNDYSLHNLAKSQANKSEDAAAYDLHNSFRLPINEFEAAVENSLHNTPVYISVDKDVLSEDEVRTNWDQGHMSLDEFLLHLSILLDKCEVRGIDICGGPDRYADDSDVKKDDEVNGRILRFLSDHY